MRIPSVVATLALLLPAIAYANPPATSEGYKPGQTVTLPQVRGSSAQPATAIPAHATEAVAVHGTGGNALANKLFVHMGGEAATAQMLHELAGGAKAMPGLPAGSHAKIDSVMRVEDLRARIVPIYAKHLDENTMAAAIKFYDSEQGRRMLASKPAISKEMAEVGQAWAAKVIGSYQQGKLAATPAVVDHERKDEAISPVANEMFERAGGEDAANKMIDQTLSFLQQKAGMRPADVAKLRAAMDVRELRNRIVPIYAKHYDEETMKAAIGFYGSAEGRKLVEKSPAIQLDTLNAAHAWAEKAFDELEASPPRSH